MKKTKGFFGEFKTFIMRGNVIDLAVGVIIGGAFQAIVNSLVNDIIMPLVGLITKGSFENLFVALDGKEYDTLPLQVPLPGKEQGKYREHQGKRIVVQSPREYDELGVYSNNSIGDDPAFARKPVYTVKPSQGLKGDERP